jgi:hypothetical protein
MTQVHFWDSSPAIPLPWLSIAVVHADKNNSISHVYGADGSLGGALLCRFSFLYTSGSAEASHLHTQVG